MFLLREHIARQDGCGAALALGSDCGKCLVLRLGITRTMEQESLEISISGSSDGRDWEVLKVFPQKFYCGTYSLVLDLSDRPEIRYIRAAWSMNCWGRVDAAPLFGFYLTAEETKLQVASA